MVIWQIREISHLNEEDSMRKHPDLGKSRILCSEKDVQSLVEVLQSSWVHPFSENSDLYSLSTGRNVPEDVKRDLLRAKGVGESAAKNFIDERLSKGSGFYDTIPKQKLKTFSMLQIKKTTADKEIMLKADNKISLFGKMLLIGCNRQLEIREVKYPRGPIP